MPAPPRILLIVSGGIAAYKSLDLVRGLAERGIATRTILTRAAQAFVTPLAFAALTADKVYSDLFSLTDESEMGHIRLSREADLVVVAPATAHILARMAAGMADDLATTALLATDKPVLVAPAMNVRMWEHPATRDNMARLRARGVAVIGPEAGSLACGEEGEGRLAETRTILDAIEQALAFGDGTVPFRPLAGRRAIVTSGPTFEPIDPVRFIGNRSSGKQGHAIAATLAALGAETILVSGPVAEPDPPAVSVRKVETAREMEEAVAAALPADIVVMAAAVADWRVAHPASAKIKKGTQAAPRIELVENPDLLSGLGRKTTGRPTLVIGFAAETESVLERGKAKRAAKGCDWMVANDVSSLAGVFGADDNTVHLIRPESVESWPRLPKTEVARRLGEAISAHFASLPGPETPPSGQDGQDGQGRQDRQDRQGAEPAS